MVQDKYIQDFTNWCLREYIRVKQNSEIFFINERKSLMPTFQLGNNVFVHIVDEIKPEDEALFQSFAHSYQTIIVIPKDVITDLVKHISRRDVTKYFKITL